MPAAAVEAEVGALRGDAVRRVLECLEPGACRVLVVQGVVDVPVVQRGDEGGGQIGLGSAYDARGSW